MDANIINTSIQCIQNSELIEKLCGSLNNITSGEFLVVSIAGATLAFIIYVEWYDKKFQEIIAFSELTHKLPIYLSIVIFLFSLSALFIMFESLICIFSYFIRYYLTFICFLFFVYLSLNLIIFEYKKREIDESGQF